MYYYAIILQIRKNIQNRFRISIIIYITQNKFLSNPFSYAMLHKNMQTLYIHNPSK